MIDNFALILTHICLVWVLLRLMRRRDLDMGGRSGEPLAYVVLLAGLFRLVTRRNTHRAGYDEGGYSEPDKRQGKRPAPRHNPRQGRHDGGSRA